MLKKLPENITKTSLLIIFSFILGWICSKIWDYREYLWYTLTNDPVVLIVITISVIAIVISLHTMKGQ